MLLDFQFRDGRADNVTRVGETKPQVLVRLDPPPVVDGVHKSDSAPDVFVVIKRFDARLVRTAALIQVAGIFLLDFDTVAEHQVGDIGRRVGRIQRSAKSIPIEAGQISAVVDMGV